MGHRLSLAQPKPTTMNSCHLDGVLALFLARGFKYEYRSAGASSTARFDWHEAERFDVDAEQDLLIPSHANVLYRSVEYPGFRLVHWVDGALGNGAQVVNPYGDFTPQPVAIVICRRAIDHSL